MWNKNMLCVGQRVDGVAEAGMSAGTLYRCGLWDDVRATSSTNSWYDRATLQEPKGTVCRKKRRAFTGTLDLSLLIFVSSSLSHDETFFRFVVGRSESILLCSSQDGSHTILRGVVVVDALFAGAKIGSMMVHTSPLSYYTEYIALFIYTQHTSCADVSSLDVLYVDGVNDGCDWNVSERIFTPSLATGLLGRLFWSFQQQTTVWIPSNFRQLFATEKRRTKPIITAKRKLAVLLCLFLFERFSLLAKPILHEVPHLLTLFIIHRFQ